MSPIPSPLMGQRSCAAQGGFSERLMICYWLLVIFSSSVTWLYLYQRDLTNYFFSVTEPFVSFNLISLTLWPPPPLPPPVSPQLHDCLDEGQERYIENDQEETEAQGPRHREDGHQDGPQ